MKAKSWLPLRMSMAIAAVLLCLALTLGCQESADTAAVSEGQTAITEAEEKEDPGVFDNRVLFGQSAALSGPAEQLGNDMMLGIHAAFHEQNMAGGVHGRQLDLTTLDDSYEPDSAYANTRQLIQREGVFALIGEVGTPTSRSASPLADAEGVPFIAPFTGAEFLRDPGLETVINLRASYYQETEEMVERLTEDLGLTRVAVLYQNDSYGQAGLEGAREALARRGLAPVESWYYQRNTSAVKRAVMEIVESNPEAIIMIGAYSPVAKTITLVRQDIDPLFMTVSFVGSNALAELLGPEGEGIYVTQVVPLPNDRDIPAVAAYHDALRNFDGNAVPGFVSLEGYLAGRLAIEGLQLCGRDLTRECFLSAIRDAGQINIDGMALQYGPGDNQGSDAVYMTVIGEDGQYQLVSRLGGAK